MVVMVWHVVGEVCKDEAVQISGENKYDTMFWCMVFYAREKNKERGVVELHIPPVKNDSSIILALA